MPRTFREPWVPKTFSAWIKKQTTYERSTDRMTGEIVRRPVDCWDLEGRADGLQWLKRFRRAGLAQTWKARMEADFAAGYLFDAKTKQFVVPERPVGPTVPTVFDLTETYYRQHPEWEPRTKTSAARSFNRARRWLVVDGAEPIGPDAEAVHDFLRHASFLPEHLAGRMTDRQRAGREWLKAHSAPADSLSAAQVEGFVARFEMSERDGDKPVSASTMIRLVQPLKGCWNWAIGRDDVPVDRSPWVVVKPRRKVKGKSTLVTGRAGLAVDADLVLSVPQSLELAQACVTEGAWGGIVECFVLVMALCGLRWGEATGLLWDDVELPQGEGPGWLIVRRTYRPTAERWLDAGEDPEWGPLKDRDVTESRRVPVPPPLLVDKLRRHREVYDEGPGGLVFHRHGRPFDHDMFGRSVWEPARSKMFPGRDDLPADDPRQPKLSQLRRHDLRHAACSWWLREGVDAVVCQRWSGHRTLSVFLDIYQGVAPGREDDGVQRLVRSLSDIAYS
jgi:integrase